MKLYIYRAIFWAGIIALLFGRFYPRIDHFQLGRLYGYAFHLDDLLYLGGAFIAVGFSIIVKWEKRKAKRGQQKKPKVGENSDARSQMSDS